MELNSFSASYAWYETYSGLRLAIMLVSMLLKERYSYDIRDILEWPRKYLYSALLLLELYNSV